MEYTRINDINTLHATKDNELFISGTDENGDDLTIIFSSFDFLQWIDGETLEHIKQQTINYIKQL